MPQEPRETTVKDGSASWVSLQGLAAGLGTYEGATIAASALGGAAGGVIAGPVGFSAGSFRLFSLRMGLGCFVLFTEKSAGI